MEMLGKRLETKHKVKTTPSCILLKSKITNFKMKNWKVNLEVFITTLEDLVNQYVKAGGNWTKDDTLEHICNAMPRAYKIVLSHLEKRIGSQTDPLTI